MLLNPTSLDVLPRAMNVEKLAQPTSHTRPELSKIELGALEETPTEISEEMILEEHDRLGEAIRTRELTEEVMQLRKQMRGEHLKIYKAGINDRKDSVKAAAKVTALNGEFARFLQGALLQDRKEERFTTGYQRLAGEAVTMF